MISIYRLRATELDERFLDALKALFQDQIIEITVTELKVAPTNGHAHEADDTDYLLASPANRRHLLESIEQLESGQPLIQIDIHDLEQPL